MSMMMTITGPSCAGKSHLLSHLLERYSNQFVSMVTETTRPQRESEVEGFEYNFVTFDDFKAAYEGGEYCQTVQFGGNFYGTKTSVLTSAFEAGKTPLRIVEPGGVQQFIDACRPLDATVFSVFVNSDPTTVMQRWLRRFLLDVDEDGDDLDQHGKITERYADRMLGCFQEEFSWLDARPYNFYLDCSTQDFNAMANALSRIAAGNIKPALANRLAPYPHEEAA